jgi:hypothetical protein
MAYERVKPNYILYSHQHISAAIAAIFRVTLLQEYKRTEWLVLAPSVQNN